MSLCTNYIYDYAYFSVKIVTTYKQKIAAVNRITNASITPRGSPITLQLYSYLSDQTTIDGRERHDDIVRNVTLCELWETPGKFPPYIISGLSVLTPLFGYSAAWLYLKFSVWLTECLQVTDCHDDPEQ